MSGTVQQLPWLDIARAINHPDVGEIANISAGAMAALVIHAHGGATALDAPDATFTPEQMAARAGLALKVIGQKVDRHVLTSALGLVPEVAAALAADPSNPPGQLMSVDILAAWARNWTDYALIIAALG